MNVEIYSKPGCTLCDEAKELLLDVQKRIPFELLEVDIEKDPLLLKRFGEEIPVVFVDGRKAFKLRIDRGELENRLERARAFSLGTLDPQKTLSRTAPVSRGTKIAFAIAVVLGILSVFGSKLYSRLVLDEERAIAGLELMVQNRPAPDFLLSTQQGGARPISAYKGKVVLLNFFATWCGPCREEMPSMDALAKALKGEQFEVVAVDVQEDWGTVDKFFGATPPAFQLALDASGKAAEAYEEKRDLMFPETFVIDREGRVVAKVEGPRNWSEPAAVHYLRRLMGS
jgi:thiol-disulfide isomerase/thioredoxin